jgi:hypothetical protein
MKRKQVDKLDNIPIKKYPKSDDTFNIDDYINEYINDFTETFTKKCKNEFMLLDILTDGFIDHLENDVTTPFEYSTNGTPFQLSELQQKAIDIFRSKIKPKGYVVSVTKKDSSSRYTTYSIVVK